MWTTICSVTTISTAASSASTIRGNWVRLAEKPIVMEMLETGRIDIFRAMQLVPVKDPVQQEALLA